MVFLGMIYHRIFQFLIVILPFLLTTHIYPQFTVDVSKITLDFKSHCFGLGQTVSNIGYQQKPGFWPIPQSSSCGSLGKVSLGKSSLEMSSQQDVLRPGAIRCALFVGGKVSGQRIFTSGEEECWQCGSKGFEFYPTGEPWDTVWVVSKGEVANIPYFPNYVGISDDDMVSRYSDYKVRSSTQTRALGIDVIQASHAWGLQSYDLWTYFDFWIIAVQNDIEDMWVGWWKFGGNGIFNGQQTNRDDLQYFDEQLEMSFEEDLPGTDGDGMGPRAYKMWPPENIPKESIRWSFDNQNLPSNDDIFWYEILSSGEIDPPGSVTIPGFGGFATLAMGPFDLAKGDTLHFRVANLVGKDIPEVLQNLQRLENLIARDFALPSAPPPPPLRVEAGNHQATLRWNPLPGQVNVETWQDPFRDDKDIEPQPFEGYRVYKSFQPNGPWTLLAEFDVPNNGYKQNTGLVHEYTDVGLLNNFEYYYAVTAFSKPDVVTGLQELESNLKQSTVVVIPGTQIPETVGEVFVVPNPYRGDVRYDSFSPPWERPNPIRNLNNEPGKDRWTEFDRRLQFVNVPSPSRIKVYTIAGDLVQTLEHNNPNRGIVDWNLTSSVNQAISSGIYLYTVEDLKSGKIQVGKFVVIK